LVRPYAEAAVSALGEAFDRLAGELAGRLPDQCDLVRDYLQPFTLRGVATMFALPEAEHAVFAKVVTALSAVLGRPHLDEQALGAVTTCMEYLRRVVDRLGRKGGELPPVAGALRGLVADRDS